MVVKRVIGVNTLTTTLLKCKFNVCNGHINECNNYGLSLLLLFPKFNITALDLGTYLLIDDLVTKHSSVFFTDCVHDMKDPNYH